MKPHEIIFIENRFNKLNKILFFDNQIYNQNYNYINFVYRKLVEDSKIDEQIYDIDDQDNNAKLLPSQIDKEKLKANYVSVIFLSINQQILQNLIWLKTVFFN